LAGQIIVDESRQIKDSISQVWDRCMAWLLSINATIMSIEKPKLIIASHGKMRGPDSNYRDWPKVIEVHLSEQESQVDLRVIIRESGDSKFIVGTENRKAYWVTLLSGLWSQQGISLDGQEKNVVFPIEYFRRESWRNVKNAASILLLLGSIGVYLIFYPLDDSTFGSGIIAALFVTGYTLSKLYNQFKLRRKFMSVHLDEKSSPGKTAWPLLLLILLSLPLTITVLYYGNYGSSTVADYTSYTGYSFSFKYPEGIELEASGLEDETSASDTLGVLAGEEMRGLGQSEGVMVMWLELPYLNRDIEDILDISDAVSLGTIRQTSVQGSKTYYRSVQFISEGRNVYSHWAVWNYEGQKRVYTFCYLNTKNVTYTRFMDMLQSFEFTPINGEPT
jgi:hypothetical protein